MSALPPEAAVGLVGWRRAASDPKGTIVSLAVKLDAVLAMLHEERELPNEET